MKIFRRIFLLLTLLSLSSCTVVTPLCVPQPVQPEFDSHYDFGTGRYYQVPNCKPVSIYVLPF